MRAAAVITKQCAATTQHRHLPGSTGSPVPRCSGCAVVVTILTQMPVKVRVTATSPVKRGHGYT
jgi:hypothetical protein